jgi:Fe-S cluster assembly iron-binding protein IscA
MKRLYCVLFGAMMILGCSKVQPSSEHSVAGQRSSPEDKGKVAAKEEGEKEAGRKNIVVLTPAAAAQIRQLMQQQQYKYLRVSISKDNQQKLDLDNEMDAKEDYLGESRSIPILVDRKSSTLIPEGILLDFVNGEGRTGFIFTAPESEPSAQDLSVTLAEARRGFKMALARREPRAHPAPTPPRNVFQVVHYDAPCGKCVAYLTPDPKDGKKRPAIIWITGGDCNSIDEGSWQEGPAGNDQSASAYRKAGIAMMFPALRGGNDNPGVKEGFFGEVEDVLAAEAFLRKQPYIDSSRIYLGGHSTGGTLVLLTAECSDRFRAVFSFGPVHDVVGYGPQYNPFVLSDPKELRLRAPGRWLHSIRRPVFVFEGTGGNLSPLKAMARSSKNPLVKFFEIKGTEHFGVLAPTNRLIADKILRDNGPTCSLSFGEDELNKPFLK